MSLEQSFERIAAALEKMAGAAPVAEARPVAHASGADVVVDPGNKVARIGRAPAAAAAEKAAVVSENPNATLPPKTTAAPPTFDEMKAALVAVKAKLGPEVSRAIMHSVKAANVAEIAPEHFALVISQCNHKLSA